MTKLLTIDMLDTENNNYESNSTLWFNVLYPNGLEIPDGDFIIKHRGVMPEIAWFLDMWPRELLSGRKIMLEEENEKEAKCCTFWYNKDGLLYKMKDDEGDITKYTYDEEHRCIRDEDEDGDSISYVYDDEGRHISTMFSLGGYVEHTYNHRGNLVTTRNKNGHVASYTYDDNDKLIVKIGLFGRSTRYTYDSNGLLSKVIHDNGTTKQYIRDEKGAYVCVTTSKTGVSIIDKVDEYNNLICRISPDNVSDDRTLKYVDAMVRICPAP